METRTQFFVTEQVAEMDSMPTLAHSAAVLWFASAREASPQEVARVGFEGPAESPR